jgi:hypothetical protein
MVSAQWLKSYIRRGFPVGSFGPDGFLSGCQTIPFDEFRARFRVMKSKMFFPYLSSQMYLPKPANTYGRDKVR